jgi:hypothetical protein
MHTRFVCDWSLRRTPSSSLFAQRLFFFAHHAPRMCSSDALPSPLSREHASLTCFFFVVVKGTTDCSANSSPNPVMSSSAHTIVPVLSPGALGRARDVTFSAEGNPTSGGKLPTHSGGTMKTAAKAQQVPPIGLSTSNSEDAAHVFGEPHAGMMQPRKSFLLKDVLSQQPTAYVPRYVVERSSLPAERWVRKGDGHAKWKPEANPRAGTPSLLVPGYKPPRADLSWGNADESSSSDDGDDVMLSSTGGKGQRAATPHYQLDSLFSRSPTPDGSRSHTSLTHFSTSALNAPPTSQAQGGAASPARIIAAGGGPQIIVSHHNTPPPLHGGEERTPHRSSVVYSRQPFLERGHGLLSSSPQSRPQSRQATPQLASSPPPTLSKKPVTLQGTPLNNGVQDAWCSSYVQLGPFRNLAIFEHDPPGRCIDGIPIDVVPPGNKKLTPLEQHRVEHAQAEFMRSRTPSAHHGHVSKEITRQTHIGLPTTSSPTRVPRSVEEHATSFSPASSNGGRSQGPSSVPHPAMHFALPSSVVLPLPAPVHPPSQLPPRSPAKLLPTCAHRAAAAAAASRGDGDGSTTGCPECRAVLDALEAFDSVRESKEERLYQHQLDLWREQQLREEDAKTVPADMMRTKSGRLVRKLVILDEGPTVAQLYHGTSHEDREALYVATCGGLSFDINKERFIHLMQKVLAPRIHVRLSDDQAAAMFLAFDVDGNGAVSYFEYLAVLTVQLLSAEQRKFLDDLHLSLYRLPFIDSGLDARTASKVMLEHRAQMQLEGELAMSINGARAASPQPQLMRRKSSVHAGMLRRKSAKLLSSSFEGDASLLGEDAGSMYQTPSKQNLKVTTEKVHYLSRSHITLERVRKIVYDLKKHNPWFPHPLDDAFADALVHCFKPLQEDDRVNLPKFRMFIFCDDDCMTALEHLLPRE